VTFFGCDDERCFTAQVRFVEICVLGKKEFRYVVKILVKRDQKRSVAEEIGCVQESSVFKEKFYETDVSA
jgi:hypothetical protein